MSDSHQFPDIRTGQVEGRYPLLPLQLGMLVNSLINTRAGVEIEQIECIIREALDVTRFKRAWTHAVRRHSILRTRFRWHDVDEPRQEVLGDAGLRWEEFDWRHLSAKECCARWQEYLFTARREPFDFTAAPPMRFALAREAARQYRFCWTHHHALADTRSYVIVWTDVIAIYDKLAQGDWPDLPSAVLFGEHAAWLHAQDWSRSEKFWRERLRGITVPTSVQVTFATSCSSTEDNACGDQQLTLSRAITATLRSFAMAHGVTLNTLLQAAWAILLSRYTGQCDVMFGAVRAGRHSTGSSAENVVGPFIVTIPFRARVPTDVPLQSWLTELREQWIAVRPHERVPLTTLQAWSDLPPGQPLFTTLLNVQDPPWDVALAERRGRWNNFQFSIRSHPHHQVALDVYAGGDLRLRLFYDIRRLEHDAASRLLDHVATILQAMPQYAGRPPSSLSILTPSEERQIIVEWNRTERPYPSKQSVHALFERQVERQPAAIAITFDDVSVSYAELNRRSICLAHLLIARGVRRGVPVGICVERSIETAVGLLAILKAGGAYVPLDPTYPDQRLAFMIKDAGVSVMLAQRQWHTRLVETGLAIIDIEHHAPPPEPMALLPMDIGGDDLAYIIYTSGSTGTPKGIAVPHRAVVRLVLNSDYIQLGADDRIGQASNLSFDAATFEFWGALLSGAQLIGIDQDTLLAPAALASHISRYRITTLFITTALFNLLAQEAPGIFRGMKQLLFGGEQVVPKRVLQVLGAGRPDRLLHVYGPTETTTFATWFDVISVDSDATTVPIGRPLANTRAYVLGPFGHPVPIGVPGELWIGGDAVARGYLNRDDLTRASFRPDPFVGDPGARCYRTGDLVRARPDGNLEFLGRLDDQVKIRGFRVELGEIRSVLSKQAGILDAVVIVREVAPGDRRLVAYVAASPEGFDVDLLWRRLEQLMPRYMLPGAIVRLDTLPLTSNGKVDRHKLPEPAWTISSPTEPVSLTPLEQRVAEIWASVLGVEKVGRHDNFLQIGGDSLLALRVIVRANQEFKLALTVSALLQNGTLTNFAAAIDSVRAVGPEVTRPSITRVSENGPQPVSFFQERILNYAAQASDPQKFVTTILLKLRGPINVCALERSFNRLMERHEALRTAFRIGDGQWVQVVQPFQAVELPVEDLSCKANWSHDIKRVSQNEAERPFDLCRGPLIRFRLVRLASQRHILILSLHHLVYDATIRWVLFKELEQLYAAYCQGLPDPLATPAPRYVDFAVWQRERLDKNSDAYQGHVKYWTARLIPAWQPMRLPFCWAKPPEADVPLGLAIHPSPSAHVHQRLEALGRAHGATLFMTLLAGLKLWLCHLTGSTDVLVGTTVNQQDLPEMQGVVGPTSNLLALRTDLSGDPTFLELLNRVSQVTIEAFAHQEMPFEEMVAAVASSGCTPPAIQVIFQLVKLPTPLINLPGVRVVHKPVRRVKGTFWGLTISWRIRQGKPRLITLFDNKLYDPLAVRLALTDYCTLLARVADDPKRRLSEYLECDLP